MVYDSLNDGVLSLVPRSACRVLDVGCGTGLLGEALRLRGAYVVGVTSSPAEVELAQHRIDEVLRCDLDQPVDLGSRRFDLVICSHVLEHLVNPDGFLRQAAEYMDWGGTLVVALPNALHWKNRIQFLAGRFRYTEGGVMDRTHLRFFDRESASSLVDNAGFRVRERRDVGGCPLSRFTGAARRHLDRAALAMLPGIFAHEFLIVATRERSAEPDRVGKGNP